MGVKILTVSEDILGANEQKARQNHEVLEKHGILTVNVMSSPGSGKTSLILQTIQRLKSRVRIGVIEGDVASSIDADLINKEGVAVIQINTAGGCHLDANMIESALNNLPLSEIELLLIENVGNLICPVGFALGEDRRVMLLSVPEGDDKPHKYPVIFTDVDAVLINKVDLLPYLDFNVSAFRQTVTGLNPDVVIFEVSCKTGDGLEAWLRWIERQLDDLKTRRSS